MSGIIVIGGDHHNTLGVIRSLGEKGLRPVALIVKRDGKTFVGKSRYISSLHIVREDADIVPYLLSHLKESSKKSVVICCHDASSSEIDLHFDELKQWFYLPGSNKQGQITHLMNKKVMSELAESCGLFIPKSQYPSHLPLEENECVFPCIVKPILSKAGTKEDIRICYNITEVNDAVSRVGIDNVQLQEYIDKDFEYQLIGCSTGKDIIIPGVSRILRPCKGSNTSFLHYETITDGFCDISKCREFIRRTGYKGLFSLEFLRDKNAQDYFMEINFRNDGNAICVTAAGVNLPYIWYLNCIGESYNVEKNADVSSKYVLPDSAEFRLLLTKQISFLQYIDDICKTDKFMEFDRKDIRPFWYMLQLKFQNLWNKKF